MFRKLRLHLFVAAVFVVIKKEPVKRNKLVIGQK